MRGNSNKGDAIDGEAVLLMVMIWGGNSDKADAIDGEAVLLIVMILGRTVIRVMQLTVREYC